MEKGGITIDIETTGLSSRNKILIFGAKSFGGKIVQYKEWEIGEKKLIKEISKEFGKAKAIIGYNIHRFDLPFIIERARILNMEKEAKQIERNIQTKRVIDVYREVGYGSLQRWAKKLGLNLKAPDVNGSCIPYLYYKKEFSKIEMHNFDDLIACEEVLKNIRNI